MSATYRAHHAAASAANAAAVVRPHMPAIPAPCAAVVPPDRWALTLAGLRGEPWPMPADLPGRACRGVYTGARAADLLRQAERPSRDDALQAWAAATGQRVALVDL